MSARPELFILILPWLLFIILGLSMIRLVYQAWQEQALLEFLRDELRREKSMIEQKQNFIRLTSHYLRTPLALINNGLELMLNIDPNSKVSELQAVGQRLATGVNQLLDRANISTQVLVAEQSQPGQRSLNPSLYLTTSLASAFIVISTAVYLLANFDIYSHKRNTVIAEIGFLFLIGVLLYSARRSHSTRQLLNQHFNRLLSQQRQLDQERNNLVKGSLNSLSEPLAELKSKLKTLEDQKLAKPVREGAATFDLILQKFTILSSLESGSMKTYKEAIDLSPMIDEILGRYADLVKEKSLLVRTQLAGGKITQDPLLMKFVLDTLVNNAVQYSPSGGQITLLSRRQGSRVEILLKDQGPGIAESKLNLLFQPFSHTEDVSADFEHRGVGLSLYLDKLIMHYLGGDIYVSSDSGQGTAIRLRLPG